MATTTLDPIGRFTILCIACLTIMVGCVVVPGLPSLAPQLGVGDAAGWIVTLPSLGVVLFGAPAGKLITKMGAHRALCLGLVLYGLFGTGAVLLHGHVAIFADRILLGGATALLMASGMTLISEHFTGTARLQMIAQQGIAIELGGVIFLAVGGMLTKYGWAAPFGLYLIAFPLLAMALAFIPKVAPHADVIVDGECRQETGDIRQVYLGALLSMLCFFTAVIVLPFTLASDAYSYRFSEAEVGYFFSFVSLVAVVAAALMPRILGSLGEARTLAIGFSAYALAFSAFLFSSNLAVLFAAAVLLGSGFGLSIPLLNSMAIERSSPKNRAQNLAYLTVAIFLGQFLSSLMEFLPSQRSAFVAASVVAIAAVLLISFSKRSSVSSFPSN